VFFNRASGSYYFYDRIGDLFGVSTATRESCRAMLLQSCRISPDAPAAPAAPDRVCVGFACSELGQERMLTSEQWLQAFRDNIQSHHRTFALLGGAADRAHAEQLIGVLVAEFPQYVFRNHCGELTLRESVAMLFTSSEFWGIDSGLLHLARIAGIRCISYWGPTDPATRLRDTWEIDEVVNYRKIACSPCVHTSEEPPCNGDNRCIQGLWPGTGEDVSGWTPIEYPKRRVGARA
jgi:ADP-heptose:LPS heptosyltransferase